ncbi:hypothetical protein Nit79A3_2963 [Nitrosomonas sp. Is79A3]
MISAEIANNVAVILGIFLAICFPYIRYRCRRDQKITPHYEIALLKHDVPSGLALPQYMLILFSMYSPEIAPGAIQLILCVFYTSHLMFMDLMNNGRNPCSRTRLGDKIETDN